FSVPFLFALLRARTETASQTLRRDFGRFALRYLGIVLLVVLILLLFVLVVVLFAPLWVVVMVCEGTGRYQRSRAEKKRLWLTRIAEAGGGRATPHHLRFALRLLRHPDPALRQQALRTVACLLRDNPALAKGAAAARKAVEAALLEQLRL